MLRKASFILFLSILLCSSCVETIILDPEEEHPVIVQCVLKAYNHLEPQILNLYYSKGKSDISYTALDNANVYLTHGRDTVGYFTHMEDSRWEMSAFIDVSTTYQLHVEIPGRDTILASTTVPHMFYAIGGLSKMEIWDSTGIEGPSHYPHYLWIVARNTKHSRGEGNDGNFSYIATNNPYADNFNVSGLTVGDLDLSGTPSEWYRDFWNVLKYRQKAEPDIPLHKEFVRIALPADYSNGLTEEERIEQHYDYRYDDCFSIICGPLECPQKEGFLDRYEMHYDVYSLSEEYDKFLRDVYTRDTRLDSDLTAVYSTENVYSNIEGGYGIFGSMVERQILIID